MNSGKYLYKSSNKKDSKMEKQNPKQNNGNKNTKKIRKEENNLINKKKKREEEKMINNQNKNEIQQNKYKGGFPFEKQFNQISIPNMYYPYYPNEIGCQYLPEKEYYCDIKEIADKIFSRGIVNNIIGAFFIGKCIEEEKLKKNEDNKCEEVTIPKSEEKELSSEKESNNNENNEQNLNEIKNDEIIDTGNNIKDFKNDNKLIKPILVW